LIQIFVPVHRDDHFTVLVFNMKYKQIEDIDNRSDHKGFTRYGGTLIEFVSFTLYYFRMITYFFSIYFCYLFVLIFFNCYQCNIFEDFLRGNSICRKDCSRLRSWHQRTLMFPFRNNTNIHDCGVFAIKAMEHFTGENEKDKAMKDLNIVCV